MRVKSSTSYGKTKMAKPREKSSSASLFAHVATPRQKALQPRVYTKGTAKADPTDFTAASFGSTGLTGES